MKIHDNRLKNDIKYYKMYNNYLSLNSNLGNFYNKDIEYKIYPLADTLELCHGLSTSDLQKCICDRHTARCYSKSSSVLSHEISRALKYSIGVNHNRKIEKYTLRYAPSAGARYPIECYLVILDSINLPKGIYHYNIMQHCLELIQTGDFRDDIYDAAHKQNFIIDASVIIIYTAIFNRTTMKYGERGYRYILIDLGHIAQNLSLLCTEMGIETTFIGGFDDIRVNSILGINDKFESSLYLCSLGKYSENR